MAEIHERATVEVQVNGEQAKNELQSLEKYATSLKDRIADAYTAGDTKKIKALEKELKKTNVQLRTMRTAAVNINEVMQNLSTTGPKELQKTLKAINKELDSGRIKRGSQEWNEYQTKLKLVNAEIKKIKVESVETESFLSRMNGNLSKWGGMIAGAAAALTGLTLAFSKMRKDSMNKEESQDNLKALTGLDDESIAWLTKQAEELSTTMDKSGLRVKQSSQEILDAYTLVGSAKPELLSNKDALNAVTIETMRLSTAAKMDLKEAVDAVTLSMNQYGASSDEAAKYTNVMAAGSKVGAVAVQSITAAIIKSGVSASGADVSIEQLVGSIETLGEKGIKDEVAGTGLKNFFLALQTGADDTNPKVVGLQTALKNLQKLSTQDILNRFKKETYEVAKTLIAGADKVDYYTKAVTGTNVATEQAAINSDNAAAKVAQMKNKLQEAGIELMEKLNPSVNLLGTYFTNMIKVLPPVIDFLQKYGKVIVYGTVVVLSYIAAVKLQHFWLTKVKTATGEYIVIQKLKSSWDKMGAATQTLHSAAMYVFSGNIKMAKKAMLAFFRILKVHPLGIIIAAITALAGGIYLLATRTKNAKTIIGEFLSSMMEERNELNKIYNQLLKTNEKTADRTKLINEFNSQFGKYLTNLLDEKSTVEDIKKAYREATSAMNDHYARELLASKQSEIVKLNIDEQSKSLKASVDVAVNATKGQKARLSEIINDVTNEVITDNPEYGIGNVRQKIYEQINKEYGAGSAYDLFGGSKGWEKFSKEIYPFIKGTNETINKVNKLKEELSPFIKNVTETPDGDGDGGGNDGDGGTGGDKDDNKAAIQKLDANFAKIKAEQMSLYAIGKITKQEFDSFVLDSEAKLLDAKMMLYSKESKEYNDLLQQKLQQQIKQNQECQKEDVQSIDDRTKTDKRQLLDSYLDQHIDKKAYEEGLLKIDREAIVRKKNLYVAGTKEFNDYQNQLEDFDQQDKERRHKNYEEKLAEFRKEYQKKSLKELKEKELADLKAVYDDKLELAEEYEMMKLAIEKKYAGLEDNYQKKSPKELKEAELNELKLAYDGKLELTEEYKRKILTIEKKYAKAELEESDIRQKVSQNTTDNLNVARVKAREKVTPEDQSRVENGDLFFTLFGAEAKERQNTLTALQDMEKNDVISHKEYLQAKAQLDGEYFANISSKMQAAYAVINSVVSAYSEYSQASLDLEEAKINKKYDAETKAAGNNTEKKKKIEERKEKELAKVKSKYADRAFKIQIAQGLAQTAIGAISAYASAAAVPVVGYILGPIAAAAAVAAGMLNMATIYKQHEVSKQGYAAGGFTPSGRWDEEKGAVHSDEFVANRFAVRNKQILPVLRLIDNAQKSNTIGSLTAQDVTSVLSGGRGLPISMPTATANDSSANGTESLIVMLDYTYSVIDQLNKRLNQPFHTVNAVDGPDGIKQAMDKYNGIQRNKSRE